MIEVYEARCMKMERDFEREMESQKAREKAKPVLPAQHSPKKRKLNSEERLAVGDESSGSEGEEDGVGRGAAPRRITL